MDDPRFMKLEALRKKLKMLEKQRQASYAFWTLWKFYAQKEDWFSDFIHDERIIWSELRWSAFTPKEQVDARRVTREYGQELWRDRKRILSEIDHVEQHIDDLLEEMIMRDSIDIGIIAPHFGASLSGLYNFVRYKPWFVPKKSRRIANG